MAGGVACAAIAATGTGVAIADADSSGSDTGGTSRSGSDSGGATSAGSGTAGTTTSTQRTDADRDSADTEPTRRGADPDSNVDDARSNDDGARDVDTSPDADGSADEDIDTEDTDTEDTDTEDTDTEDTDTEDTDTEGVAPGDTVADAEVAVDLSEEGDESGAAVEGDADSAEDKPDSSDRYEPGTSAVRQEASDREDHDVEQADVVAATSQREETEAPNAETSVEDNVVTTARTATVQAVSSTISANTPWTSTATTPTTPVPTAPKQSPLMAFLDAVRRDWSRIFSNSTPALQARRLEIQLADSAAVSGPISFGAVDPDGDKLTYTVGTPGTATGPKYGTVTIDQTTGTFVYDPDDSLTTGTITDTFTVTVRDNGLQFGGLLGFLGGLSSKSASATFTVVVGPADQTPTAVDDNFSGIVNSPVNGNVLANDSDYEGQPLTATIIEAPKYGELSFDNDGNFAYTPNADFTGQDTFTYAASDASTSSVVATVTISIAAIVNSESPTIGVQGLSWWLGLSEADTDRALNMAKSVGVSAVRLDISWYVVEQVAGTLDWTLIDPLVDKVVAREMTVLGMLYDTPAWLSGSTNPHAVPTDPHLFAQFAGAAAQHYLGRINTWEIWNEQNIPRFWDTPDPAAYAALLRAVYPAIKAVDPSATVVTGGLSPDGSGMNPLAYVTAMYAAGAGGYFDALAMHPYSFPYLPNLDSVQAVHDVMTANGDGAKKIWLTEVGAPTGTSPFAVSEEMQAQTIKAFVDAARNTSYIGPVYLYSLLDTGTNPADPEDNFGLLRSDFTPKQAWGIWL